MILVEFTTLRSVNGKCQLKKGGTFTVFEYTHVTKKNSSVFDSSIFVEE